MTLQQLITNRLRGLVNDTLASPLQKCADAVYLTWIQDFFRQLAADAQEAFMDDTGAIQSYTPAAIVVGSGSLVDGTYTWQTDGSYLNGAYSIVFAGGHWQLNDATHHYYVTAGTSLTDGWGLGADGVAAAPTVTFHLLTGGFDPDALTLASTWPVDPMYVTPALDFVAQKYFTSDSAGTRNDGKAAEHAKLYAAWFSPKA